MFYKIILTFQSVMKSYSVTIQMKTTEYLTGQAFPLVTYNIHRLFQDANYLSYKEKHILKGK